MSPETDPQMPWYYELAKSCHTDSSSGMQYRQAIARMERRKSNGDRRLKIEGCSPLHQQQPRRGGAVALCSRAQDRWKLVPEGTGGDIAAAAEHSHQL